MAKKSGSPLIACPHPSGPRFKGMIKADYLTGLALVLVSILVLVESWRMPRLEHLQVHPLSVPGIVPAFLAVVLLLFGAVLVVRSVKAGGHRLGLNEEGFRRILAEPGNRRLLLTACLSIFYAGVLVGRIPYWLATGLFLFSFVVIFEWRAGMAPREFKKIGLVAGILAITVTAAVSWAFERLFLITLP